MSHFSHRALARPVLLAALAGVCALGVGTTAVAQTSSDEPLEAALDANADRDFSVLFSQPVDTSTLEAEDFTIETFDGPRDASRERGKSQERGNAPQEPGKSQGRGNAPQEPGNPSQGRGNAPQEEVEAPQVESIVFDEDREVAVVTLTQPLSVGDVVTLEAGSVTAEDGGTGPAEDESDNIA